MIEKMTIPNPMDVLSHPGTLIFQVLSVLFFHFASNFSGRIIGRINRTEMSAPIKLHAAKMPKSWSTGELVNVRDKKASTVVKLPINRGCVMSFRVSSIDELCFKWVKK